MKQVDLTFKVFHIVDSPIEQAFKVVEEAKESFDAVLEYERDGSAPEHVIEEIIDVLQATANLADFYIVHKGSLQAVYDDQFAKKSQRPDWRKALGEEPDADKLAREILFEIGCNEYGEFIVDEQTVKGWIEKAQAIGGK